MTVRVHPWKYDQHHNQYVNVAEMLRQAMSVNRHLRVHMANGHYDLAIPYLATHYTFSHMALDPELRANVTMDHFESGHMNYVQERSLLRLKEALASSWEQLKRREAPPAPYRTIIATRHGSQTLWLEAYRGRCRASPIN